MTTVLTSPAHAQLEAEGIVVPTVGPVTRRRRFTGPKRYVSLLVLVALWQVATLAGWTTPDTVPGPAAVARAAWELITNGQLLDALGTSSLRVAIGTAIGITAGLTLGLVAGFSRGGELVVDAPMQALRAIPFTGLVPLFILWLGIDEAPKIAIVAVGVTFPIYLNAFAGIRNVDAKLVDVAKVYGLTRRDIARRVLLPGALPNLLVGLRFALSLAWIAVIVAEQLNANSGIGFLMTNARQFLRADVMCVCLVLYASLGLLTDYAVRLLERRLLVWRQGYSVN